LRTQELQWAHSICWLLRKRLR